MAGSPVLLFVALFVYSLAALVLTGWLRPDPLLLARAGSDREPAAADVPERPAGPARRRARGVVLGTLVMVVSQLVMVAIMTMTPVHMRDEGHSTAAAGLVISIHVAAMYLPSPLTGWLVDRYGRLALAAASGVTLLAAGVVGAAVPGASVVLLAVALALLGLGWNFGLVSGAAIVTDALPPANLARAQGLVDVSISLAGATGGLASGMVVAGAGFAVLALAGGILSVAVLPAVAASARTR